MKAVGRSPGRVPQLRGQEGLGTIWTIRGFLLLQIVIFLSMVAIHFGLLIAGYSHRGAGAAESVIAAILVAGLLLTWTPPLWSRRAAIAAQSIGILGVLMGLFTIALGIGPRTMLDLALNATMLLALIAGLALTLRKRLCNYPAVAVLTRSTTHRIINPDDSRGWLPPQAGKHDGGV